MESKKYFYKKISVLFSIIAVLVFLVKGSVCAQGKGTIEIFTSPDGANIYLNNEDTNKKTPATFTLEVGEYTLKISKHLYKDMELKVTVFEGKTTTIKEILWKAIERTVIFQRKPGGIIDVKDSTVTNDPFISSFPLGKFWELGIGTYDSKFFRSYLYFDLGSFLSKKEVIISAKLELYYRASYIPYTYIEFFPIGLYRITESWEENQIKWDNQPERATNPEDILFLPTNPMKAFVYWDVSDLVKGWNEGSINNYGIVLITIDEQLKYAHIKSFLSSENRSIMNRPKLEITYYMPY